MNLFWDGNEAEEAFKELTGHDCPKDGNWDVVPEEYRNCYMLKVEAGLQMKFHTSHSISPQSADQPFELCT